MFAKLLALPLLACGLAFAPAAHAGGSSAILFPILGNLTAPDVSTVGSVVAGALSPSPSQLLANAAVRSQYGSLLDDIIINLDASNVDATLRRYFAPNVAFVNPLTSIVPSVNRRAPNDLTQTGPGLAAYISWLKSYFAKFSSRKCVAGYVGYNAAQQYQPGGNFFVSWTCVIGNNVSIKGITFLRLNGMGLIDYQEDLFQVPAGL